MDLLAEIRAAFPADPYPGDHILSNCWCEECAASVENLRGKSWTELRVGDVGGDGGLLSHAAFGYYLPGLLCLSVLHPNEWGLASEINGLLVVSDLDPPEGAARVRERVGRLSPRQRRAVGRFLRWLGGQGWQAPLLVEAALAAVGDGRVEPYSHQEVLKWCRDQTGSGGRS